MPPTRALNAVVSDRTGLLGAAAATLAQLPPEAAYGYVIARIFIPVGLIVYATCGATSRERVALVTAYLTGSTTRPNQKRRFS